MKNQTKNQKKHQMKNWLPKSQRVGIQYRHLASEFVFCYSRNLPWYLIPKRTKGLHSKYQKGATQKGLIFNSQRSKILTSKVQNGAIQKAKNLVSTIPKTWFDMKKLLPQCVLAKIAKCWKPKKLKRWHLKYQRLAIKNTKDLQSMREVIASMKSVIQYNSNIW